VSGWTPTVGRRGVPPIVGWVTPYGTFDMQLRPRLGGKSWNLQGALTDPLPASVSIGGDTSSGTTI